MTVWFEVGTFKGTEVSWTMVELEVSGVGGGWIGTEGFMKLADVVGRWGGLSWV